MDFSSKEKIFQKDLLKKNDFSLKKNTHFLFIFA